MPLSSRETPLFLKKFLMTPFFTQFVLSHASDNTTSRNIGGTDAWAVPHLQFVGTVPQSLPKSPPMHSNIHVLSRPLQNPAHPLYPIILLSLFLVNTHLKVSN